MSEIMDTALDTLSGDSGQELFYHSAGDPVLSRTKTNRYCEE